MKNVQIIDSAINCTYSIYSLPDREFGLLFPNGEDVGFSDEVWARLGTKRAAMVFGSLWKRPLSKKTVRGIHGTLFYGFDEKKNLYPTRREAEMSSRSYGKEQRELIRLETSKANPKRGKK